MSARDRDLLDRHAEAWLASIESPADDVAAAAWRMAAIECRKAGLGELARRDWEALRTLEAA